MDDHVHLTLLFLFSLGTHCMNGTLHIRVNHLLSINFIQKSSSETCTDMCLQGASRLWQVDNISHTQTIYIYIMLIKIVLTGLLVFCLHLSSNLLIKVHLDDTNTFSQNAAYLFNGILDFPGKKEV